jgi:hypothetical protein
MDPALRRLIEAIHHSGKKCVIAVTGGGASVGGMLFSVPGGSRTILEFLVPYQDQALSEFLGRRPAQFCSKETALAMARRAYERASWLAPGQPVLGLGSTASLVSDRPKRGGHRVHLAIESSKNVRSFSLTLSKGARDREGEEQVVDWVLLHALAEASGLADSLPSPLLPEEHLQAEEMPSGGLISSLVNGQRTKVFVDFDGSSRDTGPGPAGVLAGSFNPLHEGHWQLAETAGKAIGGPVVFELSAVNVDKPPLDPEEIRRRLSQFAWRSPVWITRAPTFLEKARLFPGSVFVVGADTAERIVQTRYYGNKGAMTEALAEIRRQGCRFLVACRDDPAGRLAALHTVEVPDDFRDLFAAIPEAEFRVPISSTTLRAAQQRTEE